MENNPIYSPKDIGSKIKAIRKQKGITQKNLAEKAGVTQQTISALENGSIDPSLKLLLLIAGLLGLALLIDTLGKED